MPPLEAKKFLFSKAASQVGQGAMKKLLFMDATKAHLNGPTGDTDAFIDLPPEIAKAGRCAKLDFWLYGMRPAARAWEEEYATKLKGEGFLQGISSPTVFVHPEKDLECVVHGDDFTFLGVEKELNDILTSFNLDFLL